MLEQPRADAPLMPDAAPEKASRVIPILKTVGSGLLTAAKWVWSIPGVKSELATKAIQMVIKNGTIAGIVVAAIDMGLGS